jgi:hypothetical protein
MEIRTDKINYYLGIAAAVLEVLDGRGKPVPAGWLQQFEIETIIEQYLEMFGLPQPDRES